MDARTAALQNLELQQNKITAPETQVGQPGTVTPPAQTLETPPGGPQFPVQLPVQPMPIPSGFKQEQSLGSVPIPPARGQPGINVPLVSAQEFMRKRLTDARAQK